MKPIRVLNLTSSVSRQSGGLFESVRHLSQSTDESGRCEVTVVGLQDQFSADDIARWAPLEVRLHAVRGPRKFRYSPSLYAGLLEHNPDLLHLHGIWQYPSLAALRWARRTRRPYIVSPHGMLEPWSLQQSKWLKRLATLLYQRACLEKAACIRATSDLERDSILRAGYQNNIAVIPNGVQLPLLPLARSPRPPGQPRRALFLSRIHPKKGLLNLVCAWAMISKFEIRGQRFGWELRIVGPDEGGHLAEVQAKVRALGLEGQITFPGEVWGEGKTQLYADSDLFILPSYSENFGLVIAEALACQVPVITTRATPWGELESTGCGWWIETGVDPLVAALRDALSKAPAELAEMGERGRRLIEAHYSWGQIGRQMVETYEWMLGRGPKPAFVQTK